MVAANDRIHHLASARRDRITRSSRVRLLARQVAAGEYEVDANRLADVLVERARAHQRVKADLLARQSTEL